VALSLALARWEAVPEVSGMGAGLLDQPEDGHVVEEHIHS